MRCSTGGAGARLLRGVRDIHCLDIYHSVES